MYSFFIENDLISSNQSGFKQRDSLDIYQSLDQDYEVLGVFLAISKAFDKVWHKGLIHKLKQNGIGGPLLKLLSDFLKSRKQRVVLNRQHYIRPGVMFLPVFHKVQSLAPFCFLFISMIYLMVFSVTQNCLLIIPHYLQQCIILKKQRMI